MNKNILTGFKHSDHDHQICVNSALETAIQICMTKGARFTPIRHRILELIWQSHEPVLAYDLLRILRQEKDNTEPPTVYRALDFLLENELIHKIESLNAFVGCSYANQPHIGQFFICTQCKQFIEVDSSSINKTIHQEAKNTGFKISGQTVEISGLCPECQ